MGVPWGVHDCCSMMSQRPSDQDSKAGSAHWVVWTLGKVFNLCFHVHCKVETNITYHTGPLPAWWNQLTHRKHSKHQPAGRKVFGDRQPLLFCVYIIRVILTCMLSKGDLSIPYIPLYSSRKLSEISSKSWLCISRWKSNCIICLKIANSVAKLKKTFRDRKAQSLAPPQHLLKSIN